MATYGDIKKWLEAKKRSVKELRLACKGLSTEDLVLPASGNQEQLNKRLMDFVSSKDQSAELPWTPPEEKPAKPEKERPAGDGTGAPWLWAVLGALAVLVGLGWGLFLFVPKVVEKPVEKIVKETVVVEGPEKLITTEVTREVEKEVTKEVEKVVKETVVVERPITQTVVIKETVVVTKEVTPIPVSQTLSETCAFTLSVKCFPVGSRMFHSNLWVKGSPDESDLYVVVYDPTQSWWYQVLLPKATERISFEVALTLIPGVYEYVGPEAQVWWNFDGEHPFDKGTLIVDRQNFVDKNLLTINATSGTGESWVFVRCRASQAGGFSFRYLGPLPQK